MVGRIHLSQTVVSGLGSKIWMKAERVEVSMAARGYWRRCIDIKAEILSQRTESND